MRTTLFAAVVLTGILFIGCAEPKAVDWSQLFSDKDTVAVADEDTVGGDGIQTDDDALKVLTETGRSDVELVAKTISVLVHTATIYHSGKTRARQTAEIVASRMRKPPRVETTEGLKPNDDITLWKKRVQELQDDTIIVGHLPSLSKLATDLLAPGSAADLFNLPSAGTICLEKTQDNHWKVHWLATPELLKEVHGS